MGESDRQIVRELKSRIPADILPRIRQLLLYGSRARGEASEDSDLDLIALVDENSPQLVQRLDDIAYQVMFEHDFKPIISLKVLTEERFRSAALKGYSFYRHVEKEGIIL